MPLREKTYLRTCAHIEDTYQPVHSRRLIRIFTGAFWIAKDAKFSHADNEDSDQTAWIRRLRWEHLSNSSISHVATQMIEELYLSLTPFLLMWGRLPTNVLTSSLTFFVVFLCPL